MRVLCVCHGNMGRSPMMEAFLRNSLSELGVANVTVESAGVDKSYSGNKAQPDTAVEMSKRGLSLESHTSRHLSAVIDIADVSLILCVADKEAQQIVDFMPSLKDVILIVPVGEDWGQDMDMQAACKAVGDHIHRKMQEIALKIHSGEISFG